jgi:hypothetical protein
MFGSARLAQAKAGPKKRSLTSLNDGLDARGRHSAVDAGQGNTARVVSENGIFARKIAGMSWSWDFSLPTSFV